MNIVSINISVKDNNNKNIRKTIKDHFVKKSGLKEKQYTKKLTEKHNTFPKYLKKIFSMSPIVIKEIDGIDYYMFDLGTMPNRDTITLNVLIISKRIIDIDNMVNIVWKDIQEIIKNEKVRILKDNNIYLYPYDDASSDIYDPTYNIKAVLTGFTASKRDISIYFLLFILSIIIKILGIINYIPNGLQNNDIFNGVVNSILIVSLYSLMKSLIFEIIPSYRFPKYEKLKLSIKDLSSFVEKSVPDKDIPFVTNEVSDELKTPVIN